MFISTGGAPPIISQCDSVLAALSQWPDHEPLNRICNVKVEKLTQLFQDLVAVLPHPSVSTRWKHRLAKLECNLNIHYEAQYDRLIVAVAQCIRRIPVDQEPDLVNAALLIERQGYFPLEAVQNSVRSLSLLWQIYERFPHLPINGIEKLRPKEQTLESHQACEKFWLYAIDQVGEGVIGGLTVTSEKGVKKCLESIYLQHLPYSILVFDEVYRYRIIPREAVFQFPIGEIILLLWDLKSITFADCEKEVSIIDLRLFGDRFPHIDFPTIPYSYFDWMVRSSFRGVEFISSDQAQLASTD